MPKCEYVTLGKDESRELSLENSEISRECKRENIWGRPSIGKAMK